MAKRVKPQTGIKKITSLSECDVVLHKLADLRAELKKKEADADIAVNKVKEQLKADSEPILNEIKALEHSLAVYSEYHKDELFKDKKTIELSFGLFGFRKSTSVSVKKDTLAKLKEYGFTEAIKIKETPNKEIMKSWSNEKLELVGAKKIEKDSFWIEVKENDVEIAS